MRAAIFIDGGYIQSQIKQKKLEPDYRELSDYFLEPLRHSIPLDLLRCYYYYCPPYMSQEPTEDELKRMEVHEGFVTEIESLDRWSMRLGKLQKKWDGKKDVYEQKRVDVLLSVDLVRHAAAGHIQHAVLVAGDSDFVPAVEAAKEHGVTLSLWCGNQNTVHRDLMVLADEVHVFDWESFPRVSSDQQGNQQQSQQQRARRSKKKASRSQQGSGSYNQQQYQANQQQANQPQLQQQNQQQQNQQQQARSDRPRRSRPQYQKSRERPSQPVSNNVPVEVDKPGWAAKIKRLTGWQD